MKDWKGNDIDVGHTIVIVRVGSMFDGATPVFISLKDDTMEIGDPLPKTYVFERNERIKVTEWSRLVMLGAEPSDDTVNEIPINQLDFFINVQPWEILCIEGVSDNEQDYYLNYFNS